MYGVMIVDCVRLFLLLVMKMYDDDYKYAASDFERFSGRPLSLPDCCMRSFHGFIG